MALRASRAAERLGPAAPISRPALALLLLAGAAAAQPPKGEEGVEQAGAPRFVVSVVHADSDNLGRIANGPSGYYNALETQIDVARTSDRAQLSLHGDVQYRAYSREFDNETVGTLDGVANVEVVPDRFDWLSQLTYGQGRTNPLRAAGPDNRENVDVLATGPRAHFPLGERTELSVRSSFSSRRFQTSESFDNDVVLNELGVVHRVSRTTTVSLVGQTSDIEYTLDIPGYDIDSVRVRYERDLATGGVVTEVGQNKLSFTDSEKTGPLFRVVWNHSLTPRSGLGVSLNREFIDLGGLFALTTGQYGANADYLLTPNPLEEERLGLGYRLTLKRIEAGLDLSKLQERYERDNQLDNDGVNVELHIDGHLTPLVAASLTLQQLQRDFLSSERRDRDKAARLTISRQISMHFAVDGRIERLVRTGGDPFSETMYQITLAYALGGQYRPDEILE